MKSFVVANREICLKLADKFPRFFKSEGAHKTYLENKLNDIIQSSHPKKIMDVGSSNRPMLERSSDYVLTGLDIEELEGCDDLYDAFIKQSIEDPIAEKQDLIYSNAVLEHVPNNDAAIASMFGGLNDGGHVAHYFPCKNHPYALILRMVGKKLQCVIIRKLRPWVKPGVTGYPTFFDYCSPAQMSRLLNKTGFEDVELIVLYRANSYFMFFFPFFILVTAFENLCKVLNWRMFCSGVVISAKRP
ncbi:MAG: class I SAM-dependent methyltransferase [Gammaproteobacteria bacterium]